MVAGQFVRGRAREPRGGPARAKATAARRALRRLHAVVAVARERRRSATSCKRATARGVPHIATPTIAERIEGAMERMSLRKGRRPDARRRRRRAPRRARAVGTLNGQRQRARHLRGDERRRLGRHRGADGRRATADQGSQVPASERGGGKARSPSSAQRPGRASRMMARGRNSMADIADRVRGGGARSRDATRCEASAPPQCAAAAPSISAEASARLDRLARRSNRDAAATHLQSVARGRSSRRLVSRRGTACALLFSASGQPSFSGRDDASVWPVGRRDAARRAGGQRRRHRRRRGAVPALREQRGRRRGAVGSDCHRRDADGAGDDGDRKRVAPRNLLGAVGAAPVRRHAPAGGHARHARAPELGASCAPRATQLTQRRRRRDLRLAVAHVELVSRTGRLGDERGGRRRSYARSLARDAEARAAALPRSISDEQPDAAAGPGIGEACTRVGVRTCTKCSTSRHVELRAQRPPRRRRRR